MRRPKDIDQFIGEMHKILENITVWRRVTWILVGEQPRGGSLTLLSVYSFKNVPLLSVHIPVLYYVLYKLDPITCFYCSESKVKL